MILYDFQYFKVFLHKESTLTISTSKITVEVTKRETGIFKLAKRKTKNIKLNININNVTKENESANLLQNRIFT